MKIEVVELTEDITFLPDGGSRHVLTGPNGAVLSDQTFDVSPMLFHKLGPTRLEFETAKDRGIVAIKRVTSGPLPT